jgi:acetyl-CoA C-acetyltransferase
LGPLSRGRSGHTAEFGSETRGGEDLSVTPEVAIVGIGLVPVEKRSPVGLRQLGKEAILSALQDASLDQVDALYLGNMLADELSGQKHVATLVACHAGLSGIEAMHTRAATASGAAALRVAYLAVASDRVKLAMAAGVELMSDGPLPTLALTRALDAKREIPYGLTMIEANVQLMSLYLKRYGAKAEDFAGFAVNAHRNSANNPCALFRQPVDAETVNSSRIISPPLRLYDCSPICDGAAAIILCRAEQARSYHESPIRILASAVATDVFALQDRADPLALEASRRSAALAYQQAGVTPRAIDFFELHDAFSIMACLQLEAAGFVERGQGWRMAADGEIYREGRLPISTMGGLKARGHPIGASAIYQVGEMVLQMRDQAGANQLSRSDVAMTQSVGGAGTTVFTHILARYTNSS